MISPVYRIEHSESGETWREVSGWDGAYEVSDLGNVRSTDRIIHSSTGSRKLKGKPLKANRNPGGYRYVVLSKVGQKGVTCYIHALVARTFGAPGVGPVIRHLDDDKENNCLSNLMFGTHRENTVDAIRNNKMPPPPRNESTTHCRSGRHPWVPGNILIQKYNDSRTCRQCRIESEKRRVR